MLNFVNRSVYKSNQCTKSYSNSAVCRKCRGRSGESATCLREVPQRA